MPIYRAGVLQHLIDEKNLIVKDFEAQLGYSNGGLSKAIEDNSKLKQERVDRLFSIFPDLNPEWLQSGEGEMFTKKPGEKPGIEMRTDPSLYHDIIRALIKAQDELAESSKAQRRISEALLEERQLIRDTANAAISLAASNPMKEVLASLEEIRSAMQKQSEWSDAFEEAVIEQIAYLRHEDIAEIAGEFDSGMRGGPIVRKKSRSQEKGRTSKETVSGA